MRRKMVKFSLTVILDFVAFLAMSAAFLVLRAIPGHSGRKME